VGDLQRCGNRILLAHPERCAAFHRDPRMLGSLVANGVLTSITAGSLVGRFGGTTRRFALRLVQEELIHNVASDAHDLTGRAPGLRQELEQAGMGGLAQWLTEAIPDRSADGRSSVRAKLGHWRLSGTGVCAAGSDSGAGSGPASTPGGVQCPDAHAFANLHVAVASGPGDRGAGLRIGLQGTVDLGDDQPGASPRPAGQP
jgi:hypothetical protein